MNRFCRWVLCLGAAAGVLAGVGLVSAREAPPRVADFPLILASDLPKEGRETLDMIRKGGPFAYAKDGSTFSNRERLLPKEARGFYHEFTVKTPHSRDRGARRIICGGATVRALETCYYTDDHYASFKKIKE